MGAQRSAFGELLDDPAALSRVEKLGCVRSVAGLLLASSRREARWFANALQDWLAAPAGRSIEDALGLGAGPGQRRAATILRNAERDRLLLRLACALDGDARAVRVLRGTEQAPKQVEDLVRRLRELRAPCSLRAFTRARRATRNA